MAVSNVRALCAPFGADHRRRYVATVPAMLRLLVPAAARMNTQRGKDSERGPIPVGDAEHLGNWDADCDSGGDWCRACPDVPHRAPGDWLRCPVCESEGRKLPPRPHQPLRWSND